MNIFYNVILIKQVIIYLFYFISSIISFLHRLSYLNNTNRAIISETYRNNIYHRDVRCRIEQNRN